MIAAIFLSILFLFGDCGVLFISQKSFGRLPEGERLERISKSPNYKDRHFVNLEPTTMMGGGRSKFQIWRDFLFGSGDDVVRVPDSMQVIRTDLKALPDDRDWIMWFGHSSYLMNLSGKKVLVDPILYSGSPVGFANKMFKGTDVYKPVDFPDIDFLVISHDHWD